MKQSLTIICISLIIVLTSMAQDTQQKSEPKQKSENAPGSLPTVDQILDKYVKAIGGEAAFKKLTTRIIKGTFEDLISDVYGSFEIYAKAPNKIVQIGRAQLKEGSAFDISQGFNGTIGWSLNTAGGGFRELTGTELAAERREAEFYGEVKLKELYPKMTLKGEAKVGERTAYLIAATPDEGHSETMYFDKETGLLVRTDSVAKARKGSQVPVVSYLEDYREVDGIKLPFTTRIFQTLPRARVVIKYQEVEHNISIDDEKFTGNGLTVAAPPVATIDSSELPTALDAIEKAVEEKRRSLNVPGAALVIVKDDEVILKKGFGLRDVEAGLPVTPETLFAIGSCTKTFTAMAAVISADEGKLSLNDSPKKFLPYFTMRDPEANAQVTLIDLLSHRTGLKAYDNDEAWQGNGSGRQRSREEVIRIGMQAKPNARFREKGQYNNIMYIAAGEAIAKAQHSSWEEVVTTRIFNPLGMTASNLSSSVTQQSEDFSWGYLNQGKERGKFANRDSSAAAGAINSNAKDLGQWLRMLLGRGSIDGKRIVSEKGFQDMLDELVKVDQGKGAWAYYGLGLFRFNYPGPPTYGHAGGIDGYNALFMFMPDLNLGIAVLTNVAGEAGPTLYYATAAIVLNNLLRQP